MPNTKQSKNKRKKNKRKKKLLPALTSGLEKKVRSKTAQLLSHEQRRRVIGWLVERHSPLQVAKLVKQEFGKTITRQAIWFYSHSRKWQPLIKKLQDSLDHNLAKIPIANKSYRLLALQAVLKEAMIWRLTGVTPYGNAIYKLKIGEAIRAIETAEHIMEPAKSDAQKEGDFHLHLTVEQKERKNARVRDFISKNKGLLDILIPERDT